MAPVADIVGNLEAVSRQGRKAAGYLAAHRNVLLNPRSGAALAAASALAAATWAEFERRRIRSAEVRTANVHIGSLFDLRFDTEALALIDRELTREWGAFAFLGFPTLADLAAAAGQMVLVASIIEDGHSRPGAGLQTTLVDAGGDPARLQEQFPTLADRVRPESWKRARARGGDTAVLLQITVLDRNERGAGLGSLLRNAALYMLRDSVRYALTTTPVDREGGLAALPIDDPAAFTASMKFHSRGGASPAGAAPGFKAPPGGVAASNHGTDIVFMRYARDADGAWPAPRPEDLRLRSVGPIEDGIIWTAGRLRELAARGRRFQPETAPLAI